MTTPAHRIAVRDRVTEILRAGLPELEGRVFRARTWPLTEDEPSCLLVYGWEEEIRKTGGNATLAFFQARFLLAVEARVQERSRDGEAVEAELEALAGAARDLVLTDPALQQGPTRLIESIDGVKTTLGIDTRSSDLALGRGVVVFEVAWPETFRPDRPDPDCPCEDTSLAFRPIPAPSAP